MRVEERDDVALNDRNVFFLRMLNYCIMCDIERYVCVMDEWMYQKCVRPETVWVFVWC